MFDKDNEIEEDTKENQKGKGVDLTDKSVSMKNKQDNDYKAKTEENDNKIKDVDKPNDDLLENNDVEDDREKVEKLDVDKKENVDEDNKQNTSEMDDNGQPQMEGEEMDVEKQKIRILLKRN